MIDDGLKQVLTNISKNPQYPNQAQDLSDIFHQIICGSTPNPNRYPRLGDWVAWADKIKNQGGISTLQEGKKILLGEVPGFDLAAGIAAKNTGQEATARANDQWILDAREEAHRLSLLAPDGKVFVDDIRKWALRLNYQPKSPNTWGSLFKDGFVRPKDNEMRRSEFLTNHSRLTMVWISNRHSIAGIK